MQTNQAGIDLIKGYERLCLSAYKDAVGVLTIGYGHTGADVCADQRITEARANELLRHDLGKAEDAISRLVLVPLTGNQFSALVSLVFNIGEGNFATSTLLRLLNSGHPPLTVAAQFDRWNHAGGKVLSGLIKRRASEHRLFLTPDSTAA